MGQRLYSDCCSHDIDSTTTDVSSTSLSTALKSHRPFTSCRAHIWYNVYKVATQDKVMIMTPADQPRYTIALGRPVAVDSW